MSEELSLKDMDAIVSKEPVVTGIFIFEDRPVPDINYSRWEESQREEAKDTVQDLAEFLYLSRIEDTFTDNKERQKWRDGMEQRYGWFAKYYKKNALSTDTLNFVPCALSYLTDGYVKEGREELAGMINEITDMITQFPSKEYDKLSLPEKVYHMYEIRVKLYGVLEFLAS